MGSDWKRVSWSVLFYCVPVHYELYPGFEKKWYEVVDALLQLLLAYVRIQRYEGFEVDRMAAENDAKALYKAGEKKLGTDENTFIRIFSERSRAHLAAVDAAYTSMFGHSLEKVFYYSPFFRSLAQILAILN